MATTVALLEAKLRADTRDFDRALGKSETRMGKVGKAAGVAGLAIAGGLAVGLKVGFDEMVAAQKVMAQTEAVIESTGNAANVTAEHIEGLATELMELSGVDDEVIQSGENMLLTFKKIQNRAGAGNDIFDQATKATLDLSVAMGKDMPDAAILVGKALNDPVKGLGALRRVGIQFTKAQEDTIEKMVEMGDVAGAQKLILKELESQFGGSAEAAGDTLGGKLNIAKESLTNMSGELVTALLPALEVFAKHLTTLANFLSEHPKLVKVLAVGMGVLAAALLAASVASTLLNLSLLANPVGLIILGIVALGVALVVLWKRFETFRNVVKAVLNFVRDHWRKLLLLIPVVGPLLALLVAKFDWFKEKAAAAVNLVKAALGRLRDFMSRVRDTARFTFEFFRDKAQTVIDKVQAIIKKLKEFVAYVKSIPGKIGDALGSVGGFFGDIVSHVPGHGDFGSFGMGATSLVALGRQLQSMGFSVGEHPQFGGVSPVHVPGSYHYQGRALDINWPGSAEPAKLDWLYSRLRSMPGVKELLWRTAGHFDHLHVAMNRGGIVPGPRGAPVPVLAHGGETFIPTHRRGGGFGTTIINLPAGSYIYDPEGLMRLIQQASKTSGRRGGPTV